jgi:uncharacterized membrane protein YeaQ/YmgE (transglycosylase-associated protein family)
MDFILLMVGMIVVGVIMGALASVIWKEPRPFGFAGDLAVAIFTAILVGLIDWFIIPAMGISDTWKYLGVALEPALGALLALWVIRKARGD